MVGIAMDNSGDDILMTLSLLLGKPDARKRKYFTLTRRNMTAVFAEIVRLRAEVDSLRSLVDESAKLPKQ